VEPAFQLTATPLAFHICKRSNPIPLHEIVMPKAVSADQWVVFEYRRTSCGFLSSFRKNAPSKWQVWIQDLPACSALLFTDEWHRFCLTSRI